MHGATVMLTDAKNIMGPGPCVREPFDFDRWSRPLLPTPSEEIEEVIAALLKAQEKPHRSEIDLSDAEWIR